MDLEVLSIAANTDNNRNIENRTHVSKLKNSVCGDEMQIELILKNEKINLEKSLQIGDEISGHFVYGHVDTTTNVSDILELENSWEYHFEKKFNKNNRFIVEKGSISINGISLTVAKVENNTFMISVIDHTFHHTNLKFLQKSDQVNIEFDYLARFILNNE